MTPVENLSLEQKNYIIQDSYYIALSQLDAGLSGNAQLVCERALKLDPENLQLQLLLAQAYAGQGKAEKALKLYQDLSEIPELASLSNEFEQFKKDAMVPARSPQALFDINTKLEKPRVSLSAMKGRFGNNLFQYTFYKIYKEKYKLHGEVRDWLGKKIFGLQDSPISLALPLRFEFEGPPYLSDVFTSYSPPAVNVDISGYFQFHTSTFKPYKDLIQKTFVPITGIKSVMDSVLTEVRNGCENLIVIHLRFTDASEQGRESDVELFKKTLEQKWKQYPNPKLFICTDDPGKLGDTFVDYDPTFIWDPKVLPKDTAFFLDFYMITQADVALVGASTFSLFATMLNQRAKEFYRVHKGEILAFDPWSCDTF